MVLALEESCRAQIELEYGSIVQFKQQLYRVMSSEEAIKTLVGVIKVAVEQLMTCVKEFLEACWSVIRENCISTFEELNRLLCDTPDNLVRLYESLNHNTRYRAKCQQNYSKERLNKPTYCRCRSNC